MLLVLVCLTAAVGLAQYHDDVRRIHRISGHGTLAETGEPMDPVNFLLVGVDNAEGMDDDDPVLRGRRQESLLADTIMIARVDPERNRAWLLSIPRDLYVPISGSGGRDRINSALALSGPSGLIDTIQDDFAIPIHHYVQVNFAGFRNLVETIGGVPVWFENPARDQNSGLDIADTGCINLEGDQALAFVRSRYFEANVDGVWRSDPTSDHGRMSRQQVFVRAALNRAISQGARNPFELQRMLDAAEGEVVLDDSLSIDELIDLAERFSDFHPAALEIVTLPTDGANVGGAAVQLLREGEAQPMLDLFRGQSVFGTPTALVRLDVRNGSGLPGQAAEAAEELGEEGFTIIRTGDASDVGDAPTRIEYAPGQLVPAVLLARFLPVDAPVVEAAEPDALDDAGVALITGHDWAGVLDEPRPPEDRPDLTSRVEAEADERATSGDRSDAPDGADGEARTERDVLEQGLGTGEGTVPADGVAEEDPEDDPDRTSVSITTTTVTPEEFVPEPPPGTFCG